MPLRLWTIKETEENPAFLTPWAIPHFLVGMAAKERGIPFWWFELGHALYEAKDRVEHHRGVNLNTLANSVGDTVVATIGHLVASRNPSGYKWTLLYVGSWITAITFGDSIG